MNMENLNMDNVFREKLDGFSQQPPPHVWENIREQLEAHKRKKRIVLYRRIVAAAVVVLAFLAGWYFSEQSKEMVPQTAVYESKEQGTNEQEQENSVLIAGQPAESKSVNSNQIDSKSTFYASENSLGEIISNEAEKQPVAIELKPLERIRMVLLESKKAKFEIHNELIIPLAEIITDENTRADRVLIAENLKAIKASAPENSKWKMGVHISPGYSSQSVNYSETYANNMVYSANEGNSNITGGFSVQYKTSKKISIETGVYYEQNGRSSVSPGNIFSKRFEYADNLYDASGFYLSHAVNSVNGALEMNSLAGVIEFSGLPAGSEIVANLDGTTNSGSNILLSDGEYSQVFEFVEFPLYLRYSVLDSKFGLDIMGGFNTAIIADNNVYFERSGTTRNIGKTKDISKINFSGTVGLGVNYALGKNFSLSVEPRLNYYLNSINQNPDVNFRPYRIGVYTGVYYEF